jgi:hypothetical protein
MTHDTRFFGAASAGRLSGFTGAILTSATYAPVAIDADGVGVARAGVVLRETLADVAGGAPHDRILVGVVLQFAVEDFDPDCPLLQRVEPVLGGAPMSPLAPVRRTRQWSEFQHGETFTTVAKNGFRAVSALFC